MKKRREPKSARRSRILRIRAGMDEKKEGTQISEKKQNTADSSWYG